MICVVELLTGVVAFGWHVQAQQEQSGVAVRLEWDSA